MNIKTFANQKGISPQAVYKKLNQHGIQLSTITNADTGSITPDGEAVLNKLFSQPKPAGAHQLKDTIASLQTEIASLKTENEALRARVRELETERDWLRGQNTELLTRIPPALPAPGQTEKRGLLARLFGK